MDTLQDTWRKDAATFRTYGAGWVADIVEAMAGQLEAREREAQLEAITIEEAATESGYSESSIYKKVASGELENVGRKHAPRVRRSDLPRKGRPSPQPSIADAILARIG